MRNTSYEFFIVKRKGSEGEMRTPGQNYTMTVGSPTP